MFILGEKIGAGSFGTVYEGKYMDKEVKVAIKMESTSCRITSLWNEFNYLKHL